MSFSTVYEIKIKLYTNVKEQEYVDFDKNMLVDPASLLSKKEGEKPPPPFSASGLNTYPFFSSTIKYPFKMASLPFKEKMELFFQKKKLRDYLSRLNTDVRPASEITPEEKAGIINHNINVMLFAFFPTKFHIKKDIHSSYDLITHNEGVTNMLYNPLRPPPYSYLRLRKGAKLGGAPPAAAAKAAANVENVFTVNRVIWLNDFLNHPKYKELIERYIAFDTWLEKEKERKEHEITVLKKKELELIKNPPPAKSTNTKVLNPLETLRKNVEGKIKQLDLLKQVKIVEYDVLKREINEPKYFDFSKYVIDTFSRYKSSNEKLQAVLTLKTEENTKDFYELMDYIYTRYVLLDEGEELEKPEYMKTKDLMRFLEEPGVKPFVEFLKTLWIESKKKKGQEKVEMLLSKFNIPISMVLINDPEIIAKYEALLYKEGNDIELIKEVNAFFEIVLKHKNMDAILKRMKITLEKMDDLTTEQKTEFMKDPFGKVDELVAFLYEKNDDESKIKDLMNVGLAYTMPSLSSSKISSEQIEITVMIDLIRGGITDENARETYCPYMGQYMGNELDNLLNSSGAFSDEWMVDKNRFIFSTNTMKTDDISKDSYMESNEHASKSGLSSRDDNDKQGESSKTDKEISSELIDEYKNVVSVTKDIDEFITRNKDELGLDTKNGDNLPGNLLDKIKSEVRKIDTVEKGLELLRKKDAESYNSSVKIAKSTGRKNEVEIPVLKSAQKNLKEQIDNLKTRILLNKSNDKTTNESVKKIADNIVCLFFIGELIKKYETSPNSRGGSNRSRRIKKGFIIRGRKYTRRLL
jgi:hypothetical protein